MTEEKTTATPATEERATPCVVRHPDAGGRCGKRATITLYGVLNFCEEHGEEARAGAALEAYHDAANFFERFRAPHVPQPTRIVAGELARTISRMHDEGPSDNDHYRALSRAYPSSAAPEYVHEMMRGWERDEELNEGPGPLDLLLNSYYTIAKLMRLAHEESEDWLVELLDYERQGQSAQAAVALRISELGIRAE